MQFFQIIHKKNMSALKALLAFFLIFPFIAYSENSNYYSPNQNNSSPMSQGEDYQNYNGDCCETCPSDTCDSKGKQFWNKAKYPLLILTAIGAGILGAQIVGGKKGHRGGIGTQGLQGIPGPQGPQGPGFTFDTGQSLEFTLTSLFPANPAGTVIATPFVTGPDGTTIEGSAVTAPTGGGTIVFAPIAFSNPPFGFYNFGLSISNSSATTLAGITLNGTLVNASRDSSLTNELTPLAGVSIAPGESQISSTFTYDTLNIP